MQSNSRSLLFHVSPSTARTTQLWFKSIHWSALWNRMHVTIKLYIPYLPGICLLLVRLFRWIADPLESFAWLTFLRVLPALRHTKTTKDSSPYIRDCLGKFPFSWYRWFPPRQSFLSGQLFLAPSAISTMTYPPYFSIFSTSLAISIRHVSFFRAIATSKQNRGEVKRRQVVHRCLLEMTT